MNLPVFAKRAVIALGLLTVAAGVVPTSADAQQRYVTVNGMLLGPQELAIADRNAGFRVPNGDYWYDAGSGYWGMVGGPALGRVAPQPQQGWSRRNDTTGTGMIYNPDGATWQDRVWIDRD